MTTGNVTVKKVGVAAIYGILLSLTFWLLFFHLDNHLLWGDEAETAVLAKNVLQFGVPRTLDGTNYLILHGTVDETPDHVWIWSPWLQEYVTATSFMFFGTTTWAARAPFALAGWLSVAALALLAFKFYRNHWVALSCAVLLGCSEIFLLHGRQCRYYSISVLAEIFLIYGFHQLLSQNRKGIWITAAALIVEFYANYIVAFANLPALFFLGWLLRKNGKQTFFQVGTVFGIFIAGILPWLIYAHPFGQTGAMGGENYFNKFWNYLLECHFHFVPLWFLLLPLMRLVMKKKATAITLFERFLLFLLASYFVATLLAPGLYLRYLLPMQPVLCLLSAAWLFRYIRWMAIPITLIILSVTTNVLSVPVHGKHSLRFPLPNYIRAFQKPYTNRFADVLEFFKQNAKPGESVMTFDPEYPLVFYTSLQVLDGRLFGPANGKLPDWFLPKSASGVVAQGAIPLPANLQSKYDLITLPVHNSILGDSVPEPDFYEYETPTDRFPFVIYRIKNHPSETIEK